MWNTSGWDRALAIGVMLRAEGLLDAEQAGRRRLRHRGAGAARWSAWSAARRLARRARAAVMVGFARRWSGLARPGEDAGR